MGRSEFYIPAEDESGQFVLGRLATRFMKFWGIISARPNVRARLAAPLPLRVDREGVSIDDARHSESWHCLPPLIRTFLLSMTLKRHLEASNMPSCRKSKKICPRKNLQSYRLCMDPLSS